jgi:hypothetical protein
MNSIKGYNLDIHMYGFEELLGLFDLSYTISLDDLKRAKRKVLMTHPDKSKLEPKYFLFYKKAFDIVVKFYENQNKQNQELSNEKHVYNSDQQHHDKQTTRALNKNINSMDKEKFNNTFNQLFDKNMVNKIDGEKNNWFTNEDTLYKNDDNVNSQNMGTIFDKFKDTQQGLVQYKGVENLYMNSNSGNSIYDDDNDKYATCDPFSKLKYDDLRKVHKDQTVFNVSERDIDKVQQFSSVDHMMRERGKQPLNPMEKQDSERILAQQNTQYTEQIMQKEYADKLKTMQYEEKNKNILATFMRIKN